MCKMQISAFEVQGKGIKKLSLVRMYYLVERTSNCGTNDKTQAEESFQTGERRCDIIGKFYGDNGKASC